MMSAVAPLDASPESRAAALLARLACGQRPLADAWMPAGSGPRLTREDIATALALVDPVPRLVLTLLHVERLPGREDFEAAEQAEERARRIEARAAANDESAPIDAGMIRRAAAERVRLPPEWAELRAHLADTARRIWPIPADGRPAGDYRAEAAGLIAEAAMRATLLPGERQCPACRGRGERRQRALIAACPRCGGTGHAGATPERPEAIPGQRWRETWRLRAVSLSMRIEGLGRVGALQFLGVLRH